MVLKDFEAQISEVSCWHNPFTVCIVAPDSFRVWVNLAERSGVHVSFAVDWIACSIRAEYLLRNHPLSVWAVLADPCGVSIFGRGHMVALLSMTKGYVNCGIRFLCCIQENVGWDDPLAISTVIAYSCGIWVYLVLNLNHSSI